MHKTPKPIPSAYISRLGRLRKALAQAEYDALVVTDLNNIRYLSGFRGSAATLLITAQEQIIFSDFRYRLQIARQSPDYIYVEHRRDGAEKLAQNAKARGVKSLGFEAQNLTVSLLEPLQKACTEIELKPAGGIVEKLREIKDAGEIREMAKAAKITDGAYAHMLSLMKPGITEREVAFEGMLFMLRNGAKTTSFDLIVASGPNSALPHNESGERCLAKGDLLVLDIGARMPSGYCSDLTRTVVLGKSKPWQRSIYSITYAAQAKGLAAVKAGAVLGRVDAAARNYITRQGYGKYFGHGLGHGTGLVIHEAPSLAQGRKEKLAAGMVVTVEPGIYLPRRGGVRIEDLVVVTKHGCKFLSHAEKPKELPEI